MYMKVLHDELVFPADDALDRDTKSFIRGVRDAANWALCQSIDQFSRLSAVE